MKCFKSLKSMFGKQAGVERFDLIQTFHACKQEERKPVGPCVIKMKNYVAQLERLGYVLPQDLNVGIIMASLYEKCLPKKTAIPQVVAIQGGRIQKANKKSFNVKGKGKGKGKGKDKSYISKPKKPKPSAKEHTQLTPPYTPQHNGMSERKNQTATRILNMVPTKKVDKTPYELWYGKVPNLSYLKVWGCEALVKRDTPDKLQQRSVKCTEFLEKNILSQEVSGRAEELEEIQDKDKSRSETLAKFLWRLKVEEHSLRDLNEPNKYKAAILDPKSDKWVDDMNAEIQSMKDNQVWCLVDLSPNYMFLVYGGNPEAELRVDCYCDAGFETDRDDKAEYVAASEAAIEGVWIKKFILGLGIVPTINEPIKIFCDNSAALLIANEPGFKGASDTTIKDIIMFASVLNWAKLIFLKFTQMTI
ncbi:retrotransposon protein, putative, ty1-copia subclass [Tanacetum coccineum]